LIAGSSSGNSATIIVGSVVLAKETKCFTPEFSWPLAVSFSLRRSVLAVPAATPVQLELSHRLDEVRAERLLPLIDSFNKENKDVQVTLVRRGEGDAPKQLNLVTREEYSRFVANKSKFKPLHEVMREAKEKFDASKLSPELRDGLTDAKGQLFALPVAFSTPVLYVNKALFRKAGLDPENPPKTWFEAQEAAGKLADAGIAARSPRHGRCRCSSTTSAPGMVPK
jgi:sn-glycerol 3-phosphate transport system substrate-binding protein